MSVYFISYRADVRELLPHLELIDGVSLCHKYYAYMYCEFYGLEIFFH